MIVEDFVFSADFRWAPIGFSSMLKNSILNYGDLLSLFQQLLSTGPYVPSFNDGAYVLVNCLNSKLIYQTCVSPPHYYISVHMVALFVVVDTRLKILLVLKPLVNPVLGSNMKHFLFESTCVPRNISNCFPIYIEMFLGPWIQGHLCVKNTIFIFRKFHAFRVF